MHFCVYVLVPPEGHVSDLIEEALRLYSEDLEVPPYKVYPDGGEIAAMAKHYKVKRAETTILASHMKDWCGCNGGNDEKGLFNIRTSNPKGKWDWYEIGGRWEGYIRSNVCLAETLLKRPDFKKILPFSLVTPDGWWHDREWVVIEGWMKWRMEERKDGEWLRIVKDALSSYPHFRVVCVDIHR